jgi:hypothetical protein
MLDHDNNAKPGANARGAMFDAVERGVCDSVQAYVGADAGQNV